MEAGTLSSTSVPESSLLRRLSAPLQVWRVRVYHASPNVRGTLHHEGASGPHPCRHPGLAAEAAVRHSGFPLRCAVPGRAGRRCASPRLQSGKLHRGVSDGGSAACLPPSHARRLNLRSYQPKCDVIVQGRRFRTDLLYWLSVLPIVLPQLRGARRRLSAPRHNLVDPHSARRSN